MTNFGTTCATARHLGQTWQGACQCVAAADFNKRSVCRPLFDAQKIERCKCELVHNCRPPRSLTCRYWEFQGAQLEDNRRDIVFRARRCFWEAHPMDAQE